MKKVELIESYQGMDPGTILKTDGATARYLIETDVAIDPTGEWVKASDPEEKDEGGDDVKQSPAVETASLNSEEKAIMPKAKPGKSWRTRKDGKK